MLTVVCALFTACSSDDTEDRSPKPELTIASSDAGVQVDADGSSASVSADATGLSVTFTVTTNCDAWTLETPPAWIEVESTTGSLAVKILPNEQVASRSAELTLTAGNETGKAVVSIRIAQTGVAAATLELSDEALSIPSAGGSATLTYTSNQTTVEVRKNEQWLTFTREEGRIVFSADANTTQAARSAEVEIMAGAGDNTASETIIVSQEVHPTLTLSENTLFIPAAGGEATLTYTTNQSSVAIEKSADWLSLTEGVGSIAFSAAANTTGAPRSAEVTITAGTGDNTASEKAIVSQDPQVKSLIFVFKTTEAGKEVALPTLTTHDASIEIRIDYGDGNDETIEESLAPTRKHTYSSAGEFTVTIQTNNVITAFQFYNNPCLYKVLNNTLDMSGVNTLAKCFYNDTNLTEVAVNTLSPCVAATSAEQLFYNCKSLTAIPAGFFNGLGELKSFNNLFQNCTALTSVPTGLFEGFSKVTAFNRVFIGSGITAIPSRCFAGCSSVTTFNYTFNKCTNLETIPVDAFEGCTAVKEFYATFTECASLKEIPAALFAGMPALEELEYCFQHCTALTSLPAELFDNNRNLKYLDYCFMNCPQLTGETPNTLVEGNKVHLYERKNYPDFFYSPSSYEGCFSGDELLTDYAAIMQNGWAY